MTVANDWDDVLCTPSPRYNESGDESSNDNSEKNEEKLILKSKTKRVKKQQHKNR